MSPERASATSAEASGPQREGAREAWLYMACRARKDLWR
jgi:hypothetical protein